MFIKFIVTGRKYVAKVVAQTTHVVAVPHGFERSVVLSHQLPEISYSHDFGYWLLSHRVLLYKS